MDKRKAYETLTKLSAEVRRGCEKTAPDGTVLFTPDGVGVTQEFLAYMRPLIQAELTPIYVDGLPRHIYIK